VHLGGILGGLFLISQLGTLSLNGLARDDPLRWRAAKTEHSGSSKQFRLKSPLLTPPANRPRRLSKQLGRFAGENKIFIKSAKMLTIPAAFVSKFRPINPRPTTLAMVKFTKHFRFVFFH
jgi:hypothetical protein